MQLLSDKSKCLCYSETEGLAAFAASPCRCTYCASCSFCHAELCACIVQDPDAKRSKLMSDAPSLPATWQSTCMDSYADSLSRATKSDAVAEQEAQPGITTEGTATHTWRTKENRSPNLTMLQQLQGDLDPFVGGQQIADQVKLATSTLLIQNCECAFKRRPLCSC